MQNSSIDCVIHESDQLNINELTQMKMYETNRTIGRLLEKDITVDNRQVIIQKTVDVLSMLMKMT